MTDYYKRKCINSELTEDYIRENKTKISWEDICKHQTFSEEFCLEFIDLMYYDILLGRINDFGFSDEFILEHILPKCGYTAKLNFIYYSTARNESVIITYIQSLNRHDLKNVLIYKTFSRNFYIKILDFLVDRFSPNQYYYFTNIDEDILLDNKIIADNFSTLIKTKILSNKIKSEFLSDKRYKKLVLYYQPLDDIYYKLNVIDKIKLFIFKGRMDKKMLSESFYKHSTNKYTGYISCTNEYNIGQVVYNNFTGLSACSDFCFDTTQSYVSSRLAFMGKNTYKVEFENNNVFGIHYNTYKLCVVANVTQYKILEKVNV